MCEAGIRGDGDSIVDALVAELLPYISASSEELRREQALLVARDVARARGCAPVKVPENLLRDMPD